MKLEGEKIDIVRSRVRSTDDDHKLYSKFSPFERLAIEVIRICVIDFVDGKLDGDYFQHKDFEYWCAVIRVHPNVIRGKLGLPIDMNEKQEMDKVMSSEISRFLTGLIEE